MDDRRREGEKKINEGEILKLCDQKEWNEPRCLIRLCSRVSIVYIFPAIIWRTVPRQALSWGVGGGGGGG